MRRKPHLCAQLAVGLRPADELRDCVHLTRLSAARRLSEVGGSGACCGAGERSAGRQQVEALLEKQGLEDASDLMAVSI